MNSMESLLNNHFAPVTFSWGFIEAPLNEFKEALGQWHDSLERRDEVQALSGRLEAILPTLDPLSMPFDKELLVSTHSPWTAYFNNPCSGGDVFSTIGFLTQTLKTRGIIFDVSPAVLVGGKRKNYGALGFSLWGPEQTDWLNRIRVVRLAEDEQENGTEWKFVASGEIQSFEDTQQYTAIREEDKFNIQLLGQYARHFGIELFNPEFYGPAAYLFTRKGQFKRTSRRLMGDEQRNRGLIAPANI